eukprot:g7321.t1
MKFCTFLAAAFMVAVVSGDDTNEKVQTKKSKRKNCAALGYTDSLMCSNCDKMVEYFDSVELGADGDVKDLYAEHFCKNMVDKLPNVEMEFIRGQSPQLKMVDEEDSSKDTIITISKWSVDDIVAYLKEHMK